jgi:predicted ATP-grasp superfamily ATP-dependent carboligase
LTIVGASTRAAAFSAKAAGFEPWCADRFADVDQQAIAPLERIDDYPRGLRAILATSPNSPWMYTGALENYPELVDELAQIRPLYGNRGQALRLARDPLFWCRALADSGIPSPRVSLSSSETRRDGSWMRKPLRSANGANVSVWSGEDTAQEHQAEESQHYYYQQRIAGISVAAVFVAADGEAALLGVTRQLHGEDWQLALRAVGDAEGAWIEPPRDIHPTKSAFRYCGSIGPIALDETRYRDVLRLGNAISSACGLVGLFGVDAILNANGVWPVEINPRYTASIEVLERASVERTRQQRPHKLLAIEWHEAACCFRQLPGSLGQSEQVLSGKLIYYAPRDLHFSSSAARWVVERNLAAVPRMAADIPAVGSHVHRGEPVLTLFADATSARDVCDHLSRAAREFEQVIGGN